MNNKNDLNKMTTQEKDCFLKQLWGNFANIPINDDDKIEEDFYIWEKGTEKMDIWHWFDDNHSKGIVKLMNLE